MLEEESFLAIDKGDYATALAKINELLHHQAASYEIYIGKLICLLKLGQYLEAELLCERLLEDKEDEHFYDYLLHYVMILFESNKCHELVSYINEIEETMTIPSFYKEKYENIYEICQTMIEAQAEELMNEIEQFVETKDDHKLWCKLNEWKQLNVQPPQRLISLLNKKDVHPIAKTVILEIVYTHRVKQVVSIEKFGETIKIKPNDLKKMDEHPIYLRTVDLLMDIEQENPTLYAMVRELFDRYFHVHYPFVFPEEDIAKVVRALIHIGKVHLFLTRANENDKKVVFYINSIQISNEMYLKLILQ